MGKAISELLLGLVEKCCVTVYIGVARIVNFFFLHFVVGQIGLPMCSEIDRVVMMRNPNKRVIIII